MSFAKTKITLFLATLVLCGAVFVLNIIGLIPPLNLIASAVGQPKIVVRDSDLMCTSIAQVVSDDSSIYVLFGQYSIVQVYSKEGEYQYTISVYNHLNGETEIATLNGSLYVLDKVGNVYIFRDGSLSEFIDSTASLNVKQTIPFGKSDSNYLVQLGSIWFASATGEAYCAIQRPFWLSIYQGSTLWLCMLFLIILSWVILTFPDFKKPKNEFYPKRFPFWGRIFK